MEEKFTSTSGVKYNIFASKQYRYDDSFIWVICHNAEMEDEKLIGLEIHFDSFFTRLFTSNKSPVGTLRKDVVDATLRKFKGMLFYDELKVDTIIRISFDKMKKKSDKMIFEDFEIIETEQFYLKCTGYPNLNADVHTKTNNEVLRILYERYGETVKNDLIKEEIWYHPQIIQNSLDGLLKLNRIIRLPSNEYKITIEGKEYYEMHIRGKDTTAVHKSNSRKWDIFISHASEDKDTIAKPIHDILVKKGFKVWLDELTLKLGDSLRRKIDEGLRDSRYGAVILSPNFFAKEWPQNELDGLFALEQNGKKRILPIWHKLDVDDIKKYSPILAGRLSVKTSEGIEKVIRKIVDVISTQTANKEIDDPAKPNKLSGLGNNNKKEKAVTKRKISNLQIAEIILAIIGIIIAIYFGITAASKKDIEKLKKEVVLHGDITNADMRSEEVFNLQFSIGNGFWNKGILDSALYYYNIVLTLANQTNNQRAQAAALSNIASIFKIKGDLLGAYKYLTVALSLDRKVRDKIGEASDLMNIGLIYRTKGDLDSAMSYSLNALHLNEQVSNKQGVAIVLVNIGLIYAQQKEWDKAVDNLEQALSMNIEMGNKEGEASALGNLGLIHIEKKDLIKALDYFQRAFVIDSTIEYKKGQAEDLSNIGLVYRSMNKLDTSSKYFQNAYKLDEEIGNKDGLASDLNNIGLIFLAEKKYSDAHKYFRNAHDIYVEIGDKSGIAIAESNIKLTEKFLNK